MTSGNIFSQLLYNLLSLPRDCISLASTADMLTVLQKMFCCKLHVSPFGYIHFHTSSQQRFLLSCFIASSLGICVYVGEMVLCLQQMTLLAKCKQSNLCCMQGICPVLFNHGRQQKTKNTTDSSLQHEWHSRNDIYNFKSIP